MRLHKLVMMVILTATLTYGQATEPRQIAKFSAVSNDSLLSFVDIFHTERIKAGAHGYVILRGSNWAKLLNYRRITGCLRWRNVSSNEVSYVFAETQSVPEVEFWLTPVGFTSEKFKPSEPDYGLAALSSPVEVSVSQATDEYCPINFDLEYFSRFLKANPNLSGKAIIDSSKKGFAKRVASHRKKLSTLGISPGRIIYVRRHFSGERDEQGWLIPARRT